MNGLSLLRSDLHRKPAKNKKGGGPIEDRRLWLFKPFLLATESVFGDIDGAPIVDLETIIDENPDVIIASTSLGTGADLPYYFALNEERLSGVNARINDRVYGINDDLYNPGPRLVLALEELAALLHPELFQE